MDTAVKTQKLRIGGMTCVNCQRKIKKTLLGIEGVQNTNVSYTSGTAEITYDKSRVSMREIISQIESLGYEALPQDGHRTPTVSRTVGLLVIIAALYWLLEHFGVLTLLVPGRLAESGMGFGMLFVIGLATSVHCIAMCGGINLSQCIPKDGKARDKHRLSALRPAVLYNLGRVISYTLIGVFVGALGSVIVFSTAAQGVLKLIASVFMIIMGINMLGIFPWLRRLTPRMPDFFARKLSGKGSGGPLIVGLLNGLMPCGPLQAMQLYALSTGNPFAGGLSMLMFSLGTAPVMFGFGALSSALGRRFARKALTVGAVLVAVMGLSMFSQGISLTGVSFGSGYTDAASDGSGIVIEDGVQVVSSTLSPREYPYITVEAGIPVKWIIDAPPGSINGCNYNMILYEYGIEHTFTNGENIIEFTPERTGTFTYSCWMGMIYGAINVTSSAD